MNLNVLRYVIAIFEEGSMTKAAKKLFVSQSSLSQSIRQLEKELGTPLFERSKTSLKPTKAAEHYVYWAKHTLATEHKVKQKIFEMSHSTQRKLVIGIPSQNSNCFLKYVLPKFYECAENCMIIFKEHNSRELYSLLQRGSVEFIIDHPHPDWILCKGIPILNERILIAAPASMRFRTVNSTVKLPSICINELADKPFILLSGHERNIEFLNNVFSRIGCSPRIVMECVSPEIAYDAVSAQIGLTMLSEFVLHKNKGPDVCYYTLSDYPHFHLTSITYPKERTLSDDAQLLISILQEECSKLSVLPEEANLMCGW